MSHAPAFFHVEKATQVLEEFGEAVIPHLGDCNRQP